MGMPGGEQLPSGGCERCERRACLDAVWLLGWVEQVLLTVVGLLAVSTGDTDTAALAFARAAVLTLRLAVTLLVLSRPSP